MIPREETLTVDINGVRTPYRVGDTVLDVLSRSGINVPTVCYHPSLGPLETCDTCMVDVDGQLVRACSALVVPRMTILTDTRAVQDATKEALNRILRHKELACTLCDNNNGDCPVHNITEDLGMKDQAYPHHAKGYPVDESNPFYRYDPDRCILCGRCVEVCQDIEVNETLSIDWSREEPRVVWDQDVPINESSCVSCGQCATVCPVDAMMEKSMVGQAGFFSGIPDDTRRQLLSVTKKVEPSFIPLVTLSNAEHAMRSSRIKKTKTVCTFCGVGCSFDVWTQDRHILKIQPQPESPANGISTCVKGKFGWDFVNSPDRLQTPLIREEGRFRPATWDEALELVSQRLGAIKAAYGSDALMAIASSKCTNEEAYLTQKLARQVFGTNNIDNCSRYCQSPATMGLWRTVGYGGDAGSIGDMERASLVLIVGSNTAESHPVIASRLKRAQKLHGQKLIVADIREHEMARRADIFIHPKPGTDLFWISAIAKYLIDQDLTDRSFIQRRTEAFEAYRQSLEPFTLDQAEAVTGISRKTLIAIATALHSAESVSTLWAMGVTQHQAGSDTSTALSNLMLLTGNYGRPGTGCYPLRGHNNVQGTSDLGCMPNFYSGYQPVDDATVRSKFEEAWGVALSHQAGLDNHQMLDAIHTGDLKGLYLVGEDIAVVDAPMAYVREAMTKLDFLVVQDVFFSEAARYADVILPASPSLEKEGTFTNTERRIQRLYQVFDPQGESRPDWRILQDVARRMGFHWNYHHPADIMLEVTRLTPLLQGATYDRLEGYQSLQWPVGPSGEDSPLLYRERFPFPSGKARFYPLVWRAPMAPDEEFDLHVNNGRLLEHFHEGHLTYRSPGIRSKVPKTFVEVSPELALERGLQDGDTVRLISRWGRLKVVVLVTDRVSGHELYLPMNDSGDSAINRLTSDKIDRDTHTPAFKELPVRMELLESGDGEPPLPRNNHRNKTRSPQIGVRVEAKWQRDDYTTPPAKLPKGGV